MPVEEAYAPFAIVMPGRSPQRHAALAARMRRRGWTLTATEGDRVVGLTWKALDVSDLDEGSDVLLAIAEPAPRNELAEVARSWFCSRSADAGSGCVVACRPRTTCWRSSWADPRGWPPDSARGSSTRWRPPGTRS